MISARVAPLGRPISSRIFAPLFSPRGVLAFLARAGLAAFLPALACFFGSALALPPLVAFRPLGPPFFWLTPFFEEAFSGATVAPALVSALVMLVFGILFCASSRA